MANRIGEACWWREKFNDEWRPGHLRSWSSHHDEYENGPGHFPAAVVEDDKTLQVHVVFAGLVNFSADPRQAN